MTKSLRRPASDAVDRLLNPKSIAVVGSLREARFGGYVTASNLLRFGYKGKIYPGQPPVRHGPEPEGLPQRQRHPGTR